MAYDLLLFQKNLININNNCLLNFLSCDSSTFIFITLVIKEVHTTYSLSPVMDVPAQT